MPSKKTSRPGGKDRSDDVEVVLREIVGDVPMHRRLLEHLNHAVRADDLAFAPIGVVRGDGALFPDHDLDEPRRALLPLDVAEAVLKLRDEYFPLGFRHVFDVRDVFDPERWRWLLEWLSRRSRGRWSDFAQPIPRRGPGYDYGGIVHAAVLHTGDVLFITADETTVIWHPDDPTVASFEDPTNQPHLMPGGYSQLCGHHVFLTTGELLTVGGGGYGPHSLAHYGYRFNPDTKTWARTAGSMAESRWYPTAVKLGDQGISSNDHRVLVCCGHGHGDIEIYDEGTDSFTSIDGDDKTFPNLYPGLHLLPSHAIFSSSTGWGSAQPGGGPFHQQTDDQSAFFTLTSSTAGGWNNIAPVPATRPDRTKGMSVMLLSTTPPYVRILVVGGADSSTNNTYELLDATALSPATSWSPPIAFPDGEHRSLASIVLLPDGNAFVCGGIGRTNSPCAIFNTKTNTWAPMAALPSQRDYHSAAFLLPSGQVAMAGWKSTVIEIFNPPYMYGGNRPAIADAPQLVHHGATFTIESPDAAEITRVVLVRPMAITHQTDSEQRVIDMPYIHDHTDPNRLSLVAPHGGHPHSLAPQGYYMMFAINLHGIPSTARWIYLH